MEDGVDVVEDGFGGGSVAEFGGDVVEEGLGEVGATGNAQCFFLQFQGYRYRVELCNHVLGFYSTRNNHQ